MFLARFGPPGSYAVSMLVATLVWLPLKLWEGRHGSPLLAIVRAGLFGVVWGTVFPFLLSFVVKPRNPAEAEWTAGWRRTATALRRGQPPADEAERAAVTDNLPAVRRGALIGPAVGIPLFAALIGVALHVGRTASALWFAAVLAAVLVVAVLTGRRERRLRARLASVQGG
ncbi:hypothetical protein [Micromonospora maritima]|uniref:hypothetical protein n=1 Tax=Micromonospora maritima TaxID=986711 RepID=UPI00157BFECD|nr:hypothetical protein [Micromonospora maritima]